MKRLLIYLLLGTTVLSLAVLPVVADSGTETLPEEYYGVEDTLPEDLREVLPDGLFSDDGEKVTQAVGKLTDPSYLLEVLTELAGVNLRNTLALFATLCGILVLSAVANAVGKSFGSGAGGSFGFCTRVAVFAAAVSTVTGTVETVRTYFSNLSAFSAALTPLLGVLYAMGGNVRTAVASSALMELYLSLVGGLAAKTVVPLFCICLVLLLVGAFGSVDTSALSGFLRKTYTTVLAFLLLFVGVILGGQTVIAARADSVGMRSVRFAVGSFVPIVGGSVADMSRTVASSVEYLRGTVGVSMLILLAFLLLPTIFQLFFTRAAFSLAASVAGLLDCREEEKLLGGISELYGYLIGIACLSVSVVAISLTVLIKCASAVGG